MTKLIFYDKVVSFVKILTDQLSFLPSYIFNKDSKSLKMIKLLTIGTQIKMLRSRSNMSQTKLAQLSGLRQDLISDFECDRAVPSGSSLEAIEAVFDIRFNDPAVQAAFSVLAGNDDKELPNAN